MGIAAHTLMWEQDGRLYTRVQTNLDRAAFLAHLASVGLSDAVAEVEMRPDLLRLNGGSYLIVRWRGDADYVQVRRVVGLRF